MRRSYYTRASDVTVRDVITGEVYGHQRRYSPSELNLVKSNRKPRRVRRIVANKAVTPDRHPVVDAYLGIVGADN